MTETAKTTKTRRKVGYQVQENSDNGWTPQGNAHESQAIAQKWIKTNGIEGNSYQIVRVVFGPVTVKAESVVKRTLA